MDWVKEKMYQARLHRENLQQHGQTAAQVYPLKANTEGARDRLSQLLSTNQKLTWLILGMVSGAIIVILAFWMKLIDLGDGAGVNGMASSLSEHRQHSELTAQSFRTEETKEDLNQDAESSLEMLPTQATNMGNVSTPAGKDTDESRNTTSSTLHVKADQLPVATEIPSQESNRSTGPWNINLVSLHDRIIAERFVLKAKSSGVAADLHQVTVKGKNYWRVYVPGFSSAAEARAKANQIKEKLGLKDVWVVKR